MADIRTAAPLYVACLAVEERVALGRIADELNLLVRTAWSYVVNADTVLGVRQSCFLSPLLAVERCRIDRCKDGGCHGVAWSCFGAILQEENRHVPAPIMLKNKKNSFFIIISCYPPALPPLPVRLLPSPYRVRAGRVPSVSSPPPRGRSSRGAFRRRTRRRGYSRGRA